MAPICGFVVFPLMGKRKKQPARSFVPFIPLIEE